MKALSDGVNLNSGKVAIAARLHHLANQFVMDWPDSKGRAVLAVAVDVHDALRDYYKRAGKN
jgi:hypothetical protein